MNIKRLEGLVKDYIDNLKEWGYASIFLDDIIDIENLDYIKLEKIINFIFEELIRKKYIENTFLSIYIKIDEKTRFNSSNEVSIIDFMKKSKNIEFELNGNNQINKKYMGLITRNSNITPLFDENILYGNNIFHEEVYYDKEDNSQYINFLIFPETNKFYYLNEWQYGKDLDYVMDNKLYL